LEGVRAGHLLPTSRGFALRRVRRRATTTERRQSACVHHGPSGCTIPEARRPTTCNYYLCADAFGEGSDPETRAEAARARGQYESLRQLYATWDEELTRRLRSEFPGGPVLDEVLFDWLGRAFVERFPEAKAATAKPGALFRASVLE
jgi:hypothetical protein